MLNTNINSVAEIQPHDNVADPVVFHHSLQIWTPRVLLQVTHYFCIFFFVNKEPIPLLSKRGNKAKNMKTLPKAKEDLVTFRTQCDKTTITPWKPNRHQRTQVNTRSEGKPEINWYNSVSEVTKLIITIFLQLLYSVQILYKFLNYTNVSLVANNNAIRLRMLDVNINSAATRLYYWHGIVWSLKCHKQGTMYDDYSCVHITN